jgi:hypothetical protein
MSKFIAIPILAIFLLVATPVWLGAAAAPEDSFKTAAEEQKSEVLPVRVGNLTTRLLAAHERISSLFERAGVLITKFEDRGLDMTSVRAAQAEAAVAIEQTRQAIEKFKNGIPTITATAKTLPTSVRKTAVEANQAIKEAHAKVVEVIRSIRANYDHPTARTATTTP